MRIVLDTNVILAALISRGLCEAILSAVFKDHDLCISQAILDETQKNLGKKFKFPAEKVAESLALLSSNALMVVPSEVSADACRDADDCVILGTAMAAQAAYLVTGDADLLILKSFQGIPILSPRDFYERIK